MADERKVKQVMEMRIEGKLRSGGPSIKWEDTIEMIGQRIDKIVSESKIRIMCRNRENLTKWTE